MANKSEKKPLWIVYSNPYRFITENFKKFPQNIHDQIYSIYGITFNIYNRDFIYSAINHQISSLVNQQVVFLW